MRSNMQFETTNYAGDVEILKRAPFEGIAMTLDFSGVTADSDGKKIVKAGTPINANGVKATTTPAAEGNPASTDAVGILLTDVDVARPQGTILKKAYINSAVAQAHSGVTYDATLKAALPMIVFE